MWYCKMYFTGRYEIVESDAFGTQSVPSHRKYFPFFETLLSFTELDLGKISSTLQAIYTGLVRREDVTDCMAKLGDLADRHAFFLVLYTRWFYLHSIGFERVKVEVEQALQELKVLLDELPLYQKQIQHFFDAVLDVDKAGREPNKQIMRYHHCAQPDLPGDKEFFSFRPITTRFEPVDGDSWAPVLYAYTVADMISFSLQRCVEQSITVRRCKNCGRYFAQTGRVSAEYCQRPVPEGQQKCREIGAFQQWTLKQSDDPVFKVYRREYKRRFAWIKAGRITDEEFYAWSELAREMKRRCDNGDLSLEDFHWWLKKS